MAWQGSPLPFVGTGLLLWGGRCPLHLLAPCLDVSFPELSGTQCPAKADFPGPSSGYDSSMNLWCHLSPVRHLGSPPCALTDSPDYELQVGRGVGKQVCGKEGSWHTVNVLGRCELLW